MARKNKRSGLEEFDLFYKDIFGNRWDDLKSALVGPKEYILLKNPYAHDPTIEELPLFEEEPLLRRPPPNFAPPEGEPLPYYFLDGASTYAPLALDIKEEDQCLDLCAAPGGKSLVMAFKLGDEGTLTANDRSAQRKGRLRRNLTQYLPEDIYDKRIRVTGFDASQWCLHEQEAYDKILLDAPCSSERHLLETPTLLENWKPGRTKRLSKNQWTMLASAWLVLKPGGRIVYSTCSLSPFENDGVVEKLMKKFGQEAKLHFPSIEGAEKTQYGTLLLPDKSGWGPFYFSVINKKPRREEEKTY